MSNTVVGTAATVLILAAQWAHATLMKAGSRVVAALLISAVATHAADIARLSLDNASTASPTLEADTVEKVEGISSLKITTQWPTTVCLGEVATPDTENVKLVYSAKVKTALDGTAFLEMWTHIGGSQYFSRGLNDTIGGQSDWMTIQTPFLLREGQKPDKLTLNIVINGTGAVWVDDVVLTRIPLD